ncbi:hypothetical protein ACFWTE_18970 [Nocardiopsis sp. NPDC058631]|uniref:hypothetical protein n=1 Tax=Nocardiopsis sp. NPDC058631 TaxID=3346566 RepID=UPI0036646470
MAITAAATLAAYAAVAGVAGTVMATTGGDRGGPEPQHEGLPADPCSAASRSQLGAVSALLPSASFAEEAVSCTWYAEFSDGTVGVLSVRYRLPLDTEGEPQHDESAAEDEYGSRSADLVEGNDDDYWTVEVQEARELDIADEAVVSHHREGSDESSSTAEVLVRVGGVLVEVSMNEGWESRTGSADFTGDEELLISIAERAVTALE